ncbi:4-hydroxy-tetrahydrodipicolinate synthase [Rhodobium orientis]|uniref:Dihydrodipicolinate synthase family protein n=1 Tax=Rhodobium orientis TaxID=34017 RepID=A0A327JPM6_9HYPH|nr:dihydrodipicolinate synthase family protein [Rhodobium orientis]MBB4304576.1 4-hydroxy-tetrahydrodipicolinate synthase [Rhodobium orientis]MBK5951389.1 dihydrodipicolinate synthase family protein [Rhodobium orientis]RAI27536.1 dihydrodipicolinate synthase family protein [Rhodobium orientis]
MTRAIDGIVPVMLTPFEDGGKVDFESLERLVEWYIANGADTLFAVCQSSEMQVLGLEERVAIARFVVERARGRVPVIASGHVATALEDQVRELSAMADCGIDGLVLVTNRLDTEGSGFEAFRGSLEALLPQLPADLPLGLYECPAPFRRLLTDDELRLCLDTGRFRVLKDVSCDLATVTRRIGLAAGSGFSIVNANAAIAFDAMQAGSKGFAGVFTNFHPDLYAWLYRHGTPGDPLSEDLATFLVLSATAEPMGYPVLAKLHHQRLGTVRSLASRVVTYDIFERHWAIEAILDHIEAGAGRFRGLIAERVNGTRS